MSALVHLQQDFQAYVYHRGKLMDEQVASADTAIAGARLEIYADAYGCAC